VVVPEIEGFWVVFTTAFWRCGDKMPLFAHDMELPPLHFCDQSLDILVELDLL
jgi:hypothetical protein